MTPEAVPYGRKTQKPSPVPDIHILWITAGLGCDGDSVSITAATQLNEPYGSAADIQPEEFRVCAKKVHDLAPIIEPRIWSADFNEEIRFSLGV